MSAGNTGTSLTGLLKPVWPLAVGFVAVVTYVMPWVLSGEAGYIRIHDGLDGLMADYVIMKHSGFWLASNLEMVGTKLAGAAPRVCYPSEISAASFLFYFLEPYWAYVAYQFLFRIMAFTGMYALLHDNFAGGQPYRQLISVGVALCYSMLPFYTWVAGPAVLAWIACALSRASTGRFVWPEITALVVSSLFSSFVFTGFFVIGLAWLWAVIGSLSKRKIHRELFAAAAILTGVQIAVDYRIFTFIFWGRFESQRSEFDISVPLSTLWIEFWHGIDHAPSMHISVIVPIVGGALLSWALTRHFNRVHNLAYRYRKGGACVFLLALLAAFFAWWLFPLPLFSSFKAMLKGGSGSRELWLTVPLGGGIAAALASIAGNSYGTPVLGNAESASSVPLEMRRVGVLLTLCFALVAIFVFCVAWFSPELDGIKRLVPIVKQFNFSRVNFANPFIWMLAFAYGLALLAFRPWLKFVVPIALLAQLVVDARAHEHFREKQYSGVSFQEFYSEKLFEKIAAKIRHEKSSYAVASIGIHPSIAQYNGFRTADAYFALYPLEYKARFRPVVIRELQKNSELLAYFENWGNRLYVLSSELQCPLSKNCTKSSLVSMRKLDIDVPALKKLDVKYLFSVGPIENSTELNLQLVGQFEDEHSAWSITVYEVR